MKNHFQTSSGLWWKEQFLRTAQLALRQYAQTQNEEYKNQTLYFLKLSADYQTLETLPE